MAMRTASLTRRRHVLMRVRQRVDPRRIKWVTLCRATELSLKELRPLGGDRSLAWISLYGRLVYLVWSKTDQEVVTVLGDDFRQVQAWLDNRDELDEVG